MQNESSFHCSLQYVICSYSVSYESNPYLLFSFIKFILIVSSHLRIGVRSDPYHSRFWLNSCMRLFSRMRVSSRGDII